LVAVVCSLFWLAIDQSPESTPKKLEALYATLLSISGAILTMWCFSAGINSIASERANKTYDFQRTTALTKSELVIGKLIGSPLLGLFVFALTAAVIILAGLVAGRKWWVIVVSYALIVLFALLMGLLGMAFSLLMERSSPGVGVLGLFVLYMGIAVPL